MDLQTYVKGALTTESRIESAKVKDATKFLAALQAFIAAAEVLDLYKKNIYYGKPIDDDKWNNATWRLSNAESELRRGTYVHLEGTLEDLDIDPRVLHSILGIATEGGELVEIASDAIESGNEVDPVHFQEELGDLDWYHAIGVDAVGGDWGNVLATNNKKLMMRNKGKQFNAESTINRNVEAERKLLEENL